MDDTYFILFANCILSQGSERSILIDLQKNTYELISNDMINIISELNSFNSIESIINKYGVNNKKVIIEYIEYLELKEYGHYIFEHEFQCFPHLETSYFSPNEISNAVVEVKKSGIFNINKLILKLNVLQCEALVIIVYETLSVDEINEIIRQTNESSLTSLEIISEFTNELSDSELEGINNNSSIMSFIFYNSITEKIINANNSHSFKINYTKNNIRLFKTCGIIDKRYLYANQSKVLESINYNSCLYKKISIDINGDIKNCPAMPQSFGNIKDTTLEEAINHKDFKKYWNITKDDIKVCKDCEFRHICTDCRAFIENPEDMYSKPLKCGYDPYTNKWEEWSTNELKQKAIEYYGMQDLIKKDDV